MSHPDVREKQIESLRRQRGKLDRQVQEFDSKRWLSPTEEQEVRRLKRLKLATKDKMRMLQPGL